MQQRYYDPALGRFYSNDPVDALRHMNSVNGTDGFNRYSYANNNPYKFVDPDGRSSHNPSSLVLTPEQNRALRNATTVSAGAAVGARIGVKTPIAVMSVGAEAAQVVQNGPNGPENKTTIEAGAKIESTLVSGTAQLIKIEETSDSSSGFPKVTSSHAEGPKVSGELRSGSASVNSDNTAKVEVTVVFLKVTVEVNLEKLE